VHARTAGGTSAQPAPSVLLQAVLQPSSLGSVLYTCMHNRHHHHHPTSTTRARSSNPTLAPKPNWQVMSGATDLPSSSQLDNKRVLTNAQLSRIPHVPTTAADVRQSVHSTRSIPHSVGATDEVCVPSKGTPACTAGNLKGPCHLTWPKQHPRCGAGARHTHKAHTSAQAGASSGLALLQQWCPPTTHMTSGVRPSTHSRTLLNGTCCPNQPAVLLY
jgi:hypothetical protein